MNRRNLVRVGVSGAVGVLFGKMDPLRAERDPGAEAARGRLWVQGPGGDDDLRMRRLGRRLDVRLGGRIFRGGVMIGDDVYVPLRRLLEFLRESGALRLDLKYRDRMVDLYDPRPQRMARDPRPLPSVKIHALPMPLRTFPSVKGDPRAERALAVLPEQERLQVLDGGILALGAGRRAEGTTLLELAALAGAPEAEEVLGFLEHTPALGVLRVQVEGELPPGRLEVNGEPLENPWFGLLEAATYTVAWRPDDPHRPVQTREVQVHPGSVFTAHLRPRSRG